MKAKSELNLPPKKIYDIKVQKSLFQTHYGLLERIMFFGNGLIFQSHLETLLGCCLTSQLKTLHKYGLIKLIEIYNHKLIQLSTFTTTQLRDKDTKKPTLANSTILRNCMVGQALVELCKDLSVNAIEDTTTFVALNPASPNAYDKKWIALYKLRKRHCYCVVTDDAVTVYLLDIYNSPSRQVASRLCAVAEILMNESVLEVANDNTILFKKVEFRIIVEDEKRRKFLLSNESHDIINKYIASKYLLNIPFERTVISYDLTTRFFGKKRF